LPLLDVHDLDATVGCIGLTSYRKETVNASVAMEHMIPDLLISEKVR